jgi:hypothetical protein
LRGGWPAPLIEEQGGICLEVMKSYFGQLMTNLFDGSASELISTLFDISADRISDEELSALQKRIADRRKGRKQP